MSWDQLYDTLWNIFVTQTGLIHVTGGNVLMCCVGLFFLSLATDKNFEPLLLVPIGFGIFIVNFPLAPLVRVTEAGHPELLEVFFATAWSGRSCRPSSSWDWGRSRISGR